jgi:hypothetical protein
MRKLNLLAWVVLAAGLMPVQSLRAADAAPALEFTAVPVWGEDTNLAGKATGVKPDECYVAVYIKVGDHWWTKPNFEFARVRIEDDGAWTTDVTTGGDDIFATDIAAFVLPNDLKPPPADYAAELPPELAKRALASKVVQREKKPGAVLETKGPARTLKFANRNWVVKEFDRPIGPGPNRFSGRPEDVWSDEAGLHLTVRRREKNWYCTEVALDESLGYGTYAFYTKSRVDVFDPFIVTGLFTWDTEAPPPHREIDIEFARWGHDTDYTNAQFVVQPFLKPGNLVRYRMVLADEAPELTSIMVWSPGQVKYMTAQGFHAPDAVPADKVIFAWTYQGAAVPEPGRENVRINLWLSDGHPPRTSEPTELLVTDFKFIPPKAN